MALMALQARRVRLRVLAVQAVPPAPMRPPMQLLAVLHTDPQVRLAPSAPLLELWLPQRLRARVLAPQTCLQAVPEHRQ